MSKYKSQKIEINGILFDSKKEAARYQELIQKRAAGEISDLRMQVPYELIPAQYETVEQYSEKTGKRLKDKRRMIERPMSYIADFVYKLQDGAEVVEDVKGYRDPASAAYAKFVIKRKLMLHLYGIRIKEV